MKKNESHENDLTIWSHFIKAQSKLIERLCSPIHLLPSDNKVDSKGLIKVEINQDSNAEKVLSTIKKYFTKIKDEDIFLEKGFLLLDNDAIPSSKELEEFALEAKKLCIEFNPYPILEGELKDINSPLKELTNLLKAEQIEIELNKEGEILLPLKGIELFDRQYKIKREEKIGAIYSVYIPYNQLIHKKVSSILNKLLCTSDFFIDCNKFTITTTKIPFGSDLCLYLKKIIGLDVIHSIIKVVVINNKLNTEANKCHIYNDLKIGRDGTSFYEYCSYDNPQPNISPYEYLMLTYRSILLYYGKEGITSVSFKPFDEMYSFNRNAKIFDQINRLELNDETWSKIKQNLNLEVFWCNTSKNTISFDFTNEYDFINKYEQLKAFEWLDITDYKDNHKFKIKPIVPKRFEEVKKELQSKFKRITFKKDSSGQNLLIQYSYKLSDNKQDEKLKFLNTLNQYKEQGFDFTMNEQFKVKFIVEVNEKLKELEETTRFNKIKGNDIKFNEKIIGIFKKINFPILELKINDDYIDELNAVLSENPKKFNKIEPVLTGELEKIKRLENTIDKLKTDGKRLPNPNIVNFIFDSSKAKANKNLTIFEETSKEWNEIVRTKLSSNINNSQLKAVLTTLYSEDLAIIQGPPGTGKSTAISEIIWQHIRREQTQQILLTSETHLAVDNAMDKLTTPLNNLVKPIRFGKDDNLEEEGARFSLQRIENWAEREDNDAVPSVYDNGVFNWMKNIAEKSGKNKEHKNINEFVSVWKNVLNKPNSKIRTIFKNAYLDNANVIGATCSSISERRADGKLSTFIKNYCSVFCRDEYETLQARTADKNVLNEKKDVINGVEINFDVVIMDEASKATPPEFALPLLFGKKSIVVGDHRQLPPMLDENDFVTTLEMIGQRKLAQEFRKQDHNVSHFEKLFLNPNISDTIKASFDTQYRMHPQINDVIKQFYVDDNGLNCGLDPIQVNDPNLNNPVSRYHGFSHEGFIEPQTHVIWVDVNTPEVLVGTSRVNFGEVEACKNILHYLKNSNGFDEFQDFWTKPEDKEIGLISFYGRQLYYLQEATKDLKMPIRIRTVDRFQGMERNIIIVSMVRSNCIAGSKEQEPDTEIYGELGYDKQESLGFAEFPNRLNVALSRAKRLLIIVGNSKHFCKHEVYKNVYETIKLSEFDKIIDYQTLNKYNSIIPQ